MTRTNKILLSTITTLALLLNGCGGDTTAEGTASANTSGNTSSGNDTATILPPADDDTQGGGDGSGGGDGGNGGEGHIPGPPGDGSDINVTTPTEGGWYGRTVVSAIAADGKVYSHSTAGVFGELIDSNAVKDQHDIPGYGSAILQVVFPQSEWAENNGDYFSNYQKFDAQSETAKEWVFQIKNQHTVNLADAPIEISLEGIYALSFKKVEGKVQYTEETEKNIKVLENLTLIDVDNGTSYTPDELKTANLTMQGLHTRTFRWVLGTVEESDYVALDTNTNLETFDETSIKTNAVNSSDFSFKPGGKFGLPPQ